MKSKLICTLAMFAALVSVDALADKYPCGRSVRLATWNVVGFENRTDPQIRVIGNVMKNFDFIAVTELRTRKAMARLHDYLEGQEIGEYWDNDIRDKKSADEELPASNLDGKWSYITSDRLGWWSKYKSGWRQTTQYERYAFLWKTKCFELIGGRGLQTVDAEFLYDDDGRMTGVTKNEDFTTNPKYPGQGLSREPFTATFRAGNFDFTAAAMHFPFSSVAIQRAELMLLRKIMDEIQVQNGPEDDVILLGDFNFEPRRLVGDVRGWPEGKSKYFNGAWTPVIVSNGEFGSSYSPKGVGKLYDNIIISRGVREFSKKFGFIDIWSDMLAAYDFIADLALEPKYINDPELHQKMLDARKTFEERMATQKFSDHAPVWADFRLIWKDDDENDYGIYSDPDAEVMFVQ